MDVCHPCHKRVRALQEAGVLRSYHAEIDLAALGINLQALVAVRLGQHGRAVVEAFEAYALALPEVTVLYHVTGANDYLVHVMARDANHLRDIVLDRFTTRREIVHVETSLVFECARKSLTPNYVARPGLMDGSARSPQDGR